MRPTSTFEKSVIYVQSGLGLENFLRFVQSICHVVAELQDSPASAKPWCTAVFQLSLSRRFFRYFDFVPCLQRGVRILSGSEESLAGAGFVLSLAEALKSGFLGIYLSLEALTILDAMEVWPGSPWVEKVLLECYKFWFYGMACSIGSLVLQMVFYPSVSPEEDGAKDKEKPVQEKDATDVRSKKATPKEVTAFQRPSRGSLMHDLIVVGCDILIPGRHLGWINVNSLTVGSMMLVSTLLDGRKRWPVVQRAAAAVN
ncbi:hypothetical protein KEM55_000917 [Ascosphaera atra]|nr:hypothetical protein KEM55_000917 [Ascosphaera atra]